MRMDSWIVKVDNGYGQIIHHSHALPFDDANKLYYKHIDQLNNPEIRKKEIGHTGCYESKFITHMLKLYQNQNFVFQWFVRNISFETNLDNTKIQLLHESRS